MTRDALKEMLEVWAGLLDSQFSQNEDDSRRTAAELAEAKAQIDKRDEGYIQIRLTAGSTRKPAAVERHTEE